MRDGRDVPPYRDEIVIGLGLLIVALIAGPVVQEVTLPSYRILHAVPGTMVTLAVVVWLIRRRLRQLKERDR